MTITKDEKIRLYKKEIENDRYNILICEENIKKLRRLIEELEKRKMTVKEESFENCVKSEAITVEKIIDTTIYTIEKLIDEKIKEVEKYPLLSDRGLGYREALEDLKKELEK